MSADRVFTRFKKELNPSEGFDFDNYSLNTFRLKMIINKVMREYRIARISDITTSEIISTP